jgi:hypothetical protein
MAAETEAKAEGKKTPKGGRKGGTPFPRINLAKSLDYSKKLVSKTHIGPQPESTILPGVFGNSGSDGKIRASALKHFGLLEGPPAAYKATSLGKDLDATPDNEKGLLLQRAFLSCKLFKQVFETFIGDDVSRAKIEQRLKSLGVHPDSAPECAQLFLDSTVTATLGNMNGDSIVLVSAESLSTKAEAETEEPEANELDDANEDGHPEDEEQQPADTGDGIKPPTKTKTGVTLNFTVDPSSDPDKLEKQLKLLRRYGLL